MAVLETNTATAKTVAKPERANAMKDLIESEGMVKVRLPKKFDSQKQEVDKIVPVTINGEHFEIPRGEMVNVPEEVYRILENAGYLDGSEA